MSRMTIRPRSRFRALLRRCGRSPQCMARNGGRSPPRGSDERLCAPTARSSVGATVPSREKRSGRCPLLGEYPRFCWDFTALAVVRPMRSQATSPARSSSETPQGRPRDPHRARRKPGRPLHLGELRPRGHPHHVAVPHPALRTHPRRQPDRLDLPRRRRRLHPTSRRLGRGWVRFQRDQRCRRKCSQRRLKLGQTLGVEDPLVRERGNGRALDGGQSPNGHDRARFVAHQSLWSEPTRYPPKPTDRSPTGL